jgi:4-amino-4-deoxy-L-arabinose transferase-like glycosyltransferase
MVTARPDLSALVLILGIALIFRAQFIFRAPMFMQHDSAGYYLPAYELYSGEGFGVGFRRTPAYPLFLAGVLTSFGENLAGVLIAQHLLGAGTAALTYLLGRASFGRLAGLGAGLLVAVNGALIIGEHYLMTEALFIPLLTATLLALIAGAQSGRARTLIGTGLLLGLAILCRPIAQVLYPLVPLALLIGRTATSTLPWRQTIRGTLLVALGVAATLGPWTIRTCLTAGECSTTGVMGQAMLARTAYYDTGFVFYDANDPTRGPDAPRPAIRRSIQRAGDQGASGGVIARRLQDEFKLNDAETARLAREMALDVIGRQPLYYLAGTGQMFVQIYGGEFERLRTDWKTQGRRASRDEWDARVAHLVAASPTPAQEAEFERAEAVVSFWQSVYWRPWLPSLSVVGLGVALLSRGRARWALVYGLAALLLMLAAAAFDGPVPRYRYPADPYIALLAVGGALALLGRARVWLARRRPASAARPDLTQLVQRQQQATEL